MEVVNLLLAYSAFPINGNEQDKYSPLEIAAKYKNREICKALLLHSADASKMV